MKNIEEYNYIPKTYDDYSDNAEIITRYFFKYHSIEDFHDIKLNKSIYYVIHMFSQNVRTLEDLQKYMENPRDFSTETKKKYFEILVKSKPIGESKMENNIVVQTNNNPVANIKASTDVAGACKTIVEKSAIKIQGKKYVPVEGWMAIATAHGCNLSASDVKQIDGGISARGIVRRISDGLVIGEAEGFVGDDEKTWSNRPLFARRAMAQTRAMSRAARSVFAHVVVLMDAGLSTTPAEEMSYEIQPEEKTIEKPIPQKQDEQEEKTKKKLAMINNFMAKFDGYCDSMNIDKIIESIQKISQYKGMLGEDWSRVQMHVKFRFNELVNTNPSQDVLDAIDLGCEVVGIDSLKNQ